MLATAVDDSARDHPAVVVAVDRTHDHSGDPGDPDHGGEEAERAGGHRPHAARNGSLTPRRRRCHQDRRIAGRGPDERQPSTVTVIVCQPVAPSGSGRDRASGCTSPVPSVARHMRNGDPGSRPSRSTTGATSRRPRSARASRSATAPSSTRTSTVEMPRVGAQATPATAVRPAAILPPGRSMRDCVLTGASADQPRGTQYPSNWSNRCQLDRGEPLRGGDVAVQSGHDEAGGETVPGRQRFTVHRQRNECVAAVEGGGREAGGEPVDRASDDLVGVGRDAGVAQEIVEPDALPACVADEVAADLVRYARDRDVGLDLGEREQVVEGELELVVDHAGDP